MQSSRVGSFRFVSTRFVPFRPVSTRLGSVRFVSFQHVSFRSVLLRFCVYRIDDNKVGVFYITVFCLQVVSWGQAPVFRTYDTGMNIYSKES